MEGQKMYGYMRVSTREQNEARQRMALVEAVAGDYKREAGGYCGD